MFEARLRVIYGDTDQMGVVYYANYLRFFEAARAEFIRSRGLTYRDFEAAGSFLPVVDAQITYKLPCRYDDLLLVQTEVSELRRASLTFRYAIRKEGDAAVRTTGHTVHACVGTDGKPTRIPDSLRQLIEPKAP